MNLYFYSTLIRHGRSDEIEKQIHLNPSSGSKSNVSNRFRYQVESAMLLFLRIMNEITSKLFETL